jgi:short-subunit dehydrogenase
MGAKRLDTLRGRRAARELQGAAALVTGGGTGIGRGIALALARRGALVVLCGRRAKFLNAVAGELRSMGYPAAVVAKDLADPAARVEAVAAARQAFGSLQVLVNNAGVLGGGALYQINSADIERAVATNLTAPMDLTRLCLADLAQAQGSVVFVGSTTSRVPLPYAALYSATKGGLHAFCGALRYECAPLGVHLLEVYPPTVATAMTAEMRARSLAVGPWATRIRPQFTTPEAAGERIVAALVAGRHELAWGAPERLLAAVQRLAPSLSAALLRLGRSRFAHAFTPAPGTPSRD